MKTFRLAICDDEKMYAEEIKQCMYAYINESGNDMLVDTYTSGLDLLAMVESNEAVYDMYFLDVDMPNMRGIDVANELRKLYPMAVICFITAYEQYAYEAFKVDAVGYLTKPIRYPELRHLLNRCVIQVQYCRDEETARERYIEVKTQKSVELIDVKDILYIEKRRNQCVFHLTNGEIVCYVTLADVYKMLNPEIFYYVHQGFVANFSKILEVKTNAVCFGMGREIPISRKYLPKMRKMHLDKIKHLRANRVQGEMC